MDQEIEKYCFAKASFFNDAFPFAIRKAANRAENYNLTKRFHRQFWKIAYITKGHGRYVIGAQRLPFVEKSLIVTHPDAETTWDIDGEELQLYNLVFDRSFLQTGTAGLPDPYHFLKIFSAPYSDEYESPLFLLTATKEIDTLIRGIYREFEDCQPNREELIKLRFQELILLIMRRVEDRSRRNPDWSAQYIDSFIRRHFREEITLQRFSQTLELSEERICRLFRERFGCSIIAKVNQLRLEESKKLLQSTSRTCAEIAQSCGFRSSSYFFRAFLKQFGTTPEAFRKTAE